jgi:hypothetical protein
VRESIQGASTMPPKAKETLAPKEQATFRQILVIQPHFLAGSDVCADPVCLLEELRVKTI